MLIGSPKEPSNILAALLLPHTTWRHQHASKGLLAHCTTPFRTDLQEPEAAMAMLRLLVDLRDIFLLVRARAEAGGHPLLPPAWDNHKVCA